MALVSVYPWYLIFQMWFHMNEEIRRFSSIHKRQHEAFNVGTVMHRVSKDRMTEREWMRVTERKGRNTRLLSDCTNTLITHWKKKKKKISTIPEGNSDTHLLLSFSLLCFSQWRRAGGVDGTPPFTAVVLLWCLRAHPSLPIHSSTDAPIMHSRTHAHTHTLQVCQLYPIIAVYANVSSLKRARGWEGICDKKVL